MSDATEAVFPANLYDAWQRFWFSPQPAHRIAILRIVAPLAILGLLSSRLLNFREFFTDAGYHIPDLIAGPGGRSFFFHLIHGRVQQPFYIHPIGELAAHVVAILVVVFGLCVSLGLFTRVSTLVFAALLVYVALFDRVSAVSVNKLGTIVMIALCFCPSGARYSLDALMRRRPPPDDIPGAPLRFLQVQLVVMYCASGLCKSIQGDWLHNGYVLWSQLHGHYQTSLAFFLGGHLPSWVWPPLQGTVLALRTLRPPAPVLPPHPHPDRGLRRAHAPLCRPALPPSHLFQHPDDVAALPLPPGSGAALPAFTPPRLLRGPTQYEANDP